MLKHILEHFLNHLPIPSFLWFLVPWELLVMILYTIGMLDIQQKQLLTLLIGPIQVIWNIEVILQLVRHNFNKVIICWGKTSSNKDQTVTLPHAYTKLYQPAATCNTEVANYGWELTVSKTSVSQLRFTSYDACTKYYITIGY